MQRYSNLPWVWICYPVQPKLICHICDLILLVRSCFDDLRAHSSLGWVLVPSLTESAFQNFHQAMGVGVVVDGTSFSWSPDQNELITHLLAIFSIPLFMDLN